MAKKADKYYLTDPWRIIERGFDRNYSMVSESIFSLGNECMGVRGFFEEGYSGERLVGSYFNGIYERERLGNGGYKGIVEHTEFMVNAVNWLAVRIKAEDEQLDLMDAHIDEFERVLDLRTGLLTRSFVWNLKSGGRIELKFERFVCMEQNDLGVQRISVKSIDYEGTLTVALETDFGGQHQMYHKNYWNVLQKISDGDWMESSARTVNTEKYLYSGSRCSCNAPHQTKNYETEKGAGIQYDIPLAKGVQAVITRIAANETEQQTDGRKRTKECSYEELLLENKEWWQRVWEKSDIQITGDDENQQGIRYCIFQMLQTYHGAREGNNIGAKGLTGEAYNGNAFWDTETYCLPFFLFNEQQAARNLLLFRYQTLGEAKERARALDCEGAFYPIATISGKECCNLWQHASLQLQASTAVAYGIWIYEKVTGDSKFVSDYGAEMLVEICRMLATRGDWSADGSYYGYYGVMGPDEFQMMVNHNCYTNLMAKFTFTYTLRTLSRLKDCDKPCYSSLEKKLGLTEEEQEKWRRMAEHMKILYDESSCLYEQHEGFFELPHVEVDQIPVEEFPLYHHWSYDRIYRNDMIKQPDVLMFLFLFNHAFSEETLRANYDYYEPRCIHESSLSPSVHSILASQLKRKRVAYDFFQFATRMDLDNYNRNSGEGIHTTSIAAAWMNIVYGFGGMRCDGEGLCFAPSIPEKWESYAFHVSYQGKVITTVVYKDRVEFTLQQEGGLAVKVYGREYQLGCQPLTVAIPEEWR